MDFTKKLKLGEKYLLNDPILAAAIKKYQPCTISPHTDYYSELISSIVGQQLSVKAGDTIWKRVQALFGDEVPTPEELIKIDTEKLRATGVSYAKAGYMKDLAEHVLDGRLDLAHIATIPNDEVIKQLTAVKGIGQWSAHMFMIFSLGRLDILPFGDLGVRKAIQNLYDLDELPSPSVMHSIATKNKWHPYESIAAWYLWASLDNK